MLTIQNFTKTFAAHRALDSVSVSVNPGEMVALIGASGSGKSTLLRHISGLMRGDKNGGSIAVMGKTVQRGGRLRGDIRKIRADVGMIFQQFNLVDRLNVYTNVMLGALGRTPIWRTMLGLFREEDRRLAFEALNRVGIVDKSYQRASTLSGGQQQRAAIARALVQKAKLLLADEPIASLDPESSRRVMEILADINTRDGITVLVTLHQVDYAIKYCKRTIALKDGKIVYDGPSAALTPAFLREIYGAASEEMFAPMTEKAAPKADQGGGAAKPRLKAPVRIPVTTTNPVAA
ncbi:phosphonate/organophosphate ester transporter subunit; ATP-binding component of ABC superfamily [uncultured delta proteobacterium]|uniref:Phosphonate/organophosphate ester transporter subunit ATP-binding component of ABC superfamily n=1 Tax=uncultured delta proteobacterium TaxID=34034 RepID=A0A212K6K8_9DELT|nr:phosphonate/organophosphate ester transporter subunit; ATP-binding component of ABC superfamily [uncultured delta proteobacterium]